MNKVVSSAASRTLSDRERHVVLTLTTFASFGPRLLRNLASSIKLDIRIELQTKLGGDGDDAGSRIFRSFESAIVTLPMTTRRYRAGCYFSLDSTEQCLMPSFFYME